MRTEVGNPMGVTQVGPSTLAQGALIASCVADAVNGFTVAAADVKKFYVGMKIDIKTRATGASLAQDRLVVGINRTTATITYDGADVASGGADGAYPAEVSGTNTGTDSKTNVNGGPSAMESGSLLGPSVSNMREALKVAEVGTFTDAYLDKLSYNDLVYAYRVKVTGGVK